MGDSQPVGLLAVMHSEMLLSAKKGDDSCLLPRTMDVIQLTDSLLCRHVCEPAIVKCWHMRRLRRASSGYGRITEMTSRGSMLEQAP